MVSVIVTGKNVSENACLDYCLYFGVSQQYQVAGIQSVSLCL